jgi:carboxyl-terminal processing protease
MKKWINKSGKLALGLIVGVGLTVSFAFTTNYFDVSKQLDIFNTLFKELNMYYVDETDPGKLMNKAIDAMLESLDPYTTYIPEEDIEDYRFQQTGQYGGVGAIIRRDGDYVIIAEPYHGFPADKAGLIAGDKIKEIDGKSVKGKNTSDISSVLKGEPGTEVELKIERAISGKEIVTKIKREEIQVKSVPYAGVLEGEIGYIRLRSFTETASKDVKDALKKLKAESQLKGLVLDLRGNPGGLLREAVNICNIFIPKGQEVVSTKGKIKEWDRIYKTSNAPIDIEIPLTILISRSSASASEIVAGTLQDLDRAVIVGERSFGKGLVQQPRKLTYGSQLKVTIAKYYTPSGRCIQAIDYSNRNDDGSVGKMADSLRTKFSTTNGRAVYDGGGVDPDTDTEALKYGQIVGSLIRKNLVFDFATKYKYEHPSIASPETFKVDEKLYEEFVSFLSDKDYEYETETEKSLNKWKKNAEDENYFDGVASIYEQLKTELEAHKEDDIHKYQDQIDDLIKDEIVSRYYYQEGRLRTNLVEDLDVKKAISVLSDADAYAKILAPSKK